MAIDIKITDHVYDIDLSQAKFTGPWTATAVAIAAGQLIEADGSGTVQLVSDATTGRFVGIAIKDYDASATDVICMYNVTGLVSSESAHLPGATAYGYDGGGVTDLTSEGPACGVFVGARGAEKAAYSRVHFQLGMGPALS